MERRGKHKKNRKIKNAAVFLILAITGFQAAMELKAYWFYIPFRLEADCREQKPEVETMKTWEEQEKDGEGGILDVAGWRAADEKLVFGMSTGRSESAKLTEVYGNMELAFPADILAGTYGIPGQKDVCVISRELADSLFGNVDVEGEQVCFLEERKEKDNDERRILTVAGVIGQEGKYLLVYVEEGKMERIAVLFDKRFQAKEKMEALLGAGGT